MSDILSIMNVTTMSITISVTHFEELEQDEEDRVNAKVCYDLTHFDK